MKHLTVGSLGSRRLTYGDAQIVPSVRTPDGIEISLAHRNLVPGPFCQFNYGRA